MSLNSETTKRLETLTELWITSSSHFPQRPALRVGGDTYTYAQLDCAAQSLSKVIADNGNSTQVGIFASRSLISYVGVLATLLAGRTYVPLLPDFPAARLVQMIERSGVGAIVVSSESMDRLAEVMPLVSPTITWIIDSGAAGSLPDWNASHNLMFLDLRNSTVGSFTAIIPDPASTAYLLFTSGSTGNPKGVGVSHHNVMTYVKHMTTHLQMVAEDRCSQMFDLTFDLSVHDLFVTWGSGACLCVPDRAEMMLPARYIREEALTVWFSVPSVAMIMDKLRTLRPDVFPLLRMSLFCGEALPSSLAAKWHSAAPQSVIENLYGPTEATIAITSHQWTPDDPDDAIVPIGTPFPGHEAAVIRPDLSLCKVGETGELLLAGPQITTGYWNDLERTALAYLTLPNDPRTWYRTGDLVQVSATGVLRYKGRIDDQVQVMGFRVELVEVDQALRAALGTSSAVAVSYPPGPSAEAIYAFVSHSEDSMNEAELLDLCRKTLPSYMIPKRIFWVDQLPTNSNGKIDRMKLTHELESLRLV